MKGQTLELAIDHHMKEKLSILSLFASLFYNTALTLRQESPVPINRTKQMADVDYLYSKAGIEPLPRSVTYQLLLELDVVTFTPAESQERSLDRFHALMWSGEDIEVVNDGILLQPDIRLPLPELDDVSGILTRVRVKAIVEDVAVVRFHWKRIPRTGPGRDRKRAFGYTSTVDAVKNYVVGLGRLIR